MKFDLTPAEIEQASAARDSVMHPADFEYGMGGEAEPMPDDIMLGDGFGSAETGVGSDPFGGGIPVGDPYGGGVPPMGDVPAGGGGFPGGMDAFGNPIGGMGFPGAFGQDLQQRDSKDFDEKAAEAAGMLAKGGWELLKTCIKAFPSLSAGDRMSMYKRNAVTGIAFAVFGVILLICGQRIGWRTLFGGALTGAVGFCLFAYEHNKQLKYGAQTESALSNDEDPVQDMQDGDDLGIGTEESSDGGLFDFEESSVFGVNDETEGAETSDFAEVSGFPADMQGFEADIDDNTPVFGMDDGQEVIIPMDYDDNDEDYESEYGRSGDVPDRSLDSVTVSNGMVTRQYLFEKFYSAIEHSTPDFAEFVNLSDKSEEFRNWNAVVTNALSVLAPAKSPEVFLVSVKKKIFCYVLEIQRAPWMKNKEAIVNEIVNAVAYDKKTNRVNPDIYGTAELVAKSLIVKIVTGDTALVTIKDIMKAEREFFLDTKNIMPVAVGISEDGTVITDDLRYVDYMMFSGLPRAGKSWFVKSVIGQLMFFNAPDEVNFYFLDPKDHASDFASVRTPHVKRFIADDAAIVETLEMLVHKEAAKRSAELSRYGVQNIWELRKIRPDVDMPVIYIVIDEVITLISRMEKDAAKDFQSLLLECISRCAFVGIRMILIPHLVKNQILNKSITDMITWRACVGGTNEQVISVTGDKKFRAKLSAVGDAALLHNSVVEYVHSCSIAATNAGYNNAFAFIAAFWNKVDPRYVTDIMVVHSPINFVRIAEPDIVNVGISSAGISGTARPVRRMNTVHRSTANSVAGALQRDTVYVLDTGDEEEDIWGD